MLTEKKPSQIIREWPDEEWCSGIGRIFDSRGRVVGRCDADILLLTGGFYSLPPGKREWYMVEGFLEMTFGIPQWLTKRLVTTNDTMGRDAGADLLEAHGF